MPGGQYHTYPLGRGKVQVRIHNLADKFDQLNQFEQSALTETKFIDMNSFARDLYLEANPGAKGAPQFKITEMSLSGNQKWKDNEEYKLNNMWRGEDDNMNSEVQKH